MCSCSSFLQLAVCVCALVRACVFVCVGVRVYICLCVCPCVRAKRRVKRPLCVHAKRRVKRPLQSSFVVIVFTERHFGCHMPFGLSLAMNPTTDPKQSNQKKRTCRQMTLGMGATRTISTQIIIDLHACTPARSVIPPSAEHTIE